MLSSWKTNKQLVIDLHTTTYPLSFLAGTETVIVCRMSILDIYRPISFWRCGQTDRVVSEEGPTGPEQDLSYMQSGDDDAASEGCDGPIQILCIACSAQTCFMIFRTIHTYISGVLQEVG